MLSFVWDLCFSPDGKLVVAAVGCNVLVYRAECGTLLKTLKGHRDTCLCVNFSSDGSHFASGGVDNVVIVWRSVTFDGILKYTHNSSIQGVCFNPKMLLLASCSSYDIGTLSLMTK
ncbi:unnamed protein product [Hydatigera taeniaeformis]|uniref:Intraflagellar transport protein 122 homolog n=1 Tax=Hydatigena taeniaeformis TaxID=6205 RepID=A0A0R3X3D4_HYDTA|nr:unnamed protein product [Hydatigera taeniaeformis]